MQGIALSGPVENTQHGRRNEMEDDTVSHVATKKRIKKKVFRTKKKKKNIMGGPPGGIGGFIPLKFYGSGMCSQY